MRVKHTANYARRVDFTGSSFKIIFVEKRSYMEKGRTFNQPCCLRAVNASFT